MTICLSYLHSLLREKTLINFIIHLVKKSDTLVQVRGVSQTRLLLFAFVSKLSSTNSCKLPASNEHTSLLTAMAVKEGPGQPGELMDVSCFSL